MALIHCSECGSEVSDKAVECPQCGAKLHEQDVIRKVCEECGGELTEGEVICHKCGCPVQDNAQKEAVVVQPVKKFNTKKLIIIVVALVTLLGAAFGVHSMQEKAKKAAAEAERVEKIEKYADNLSVVTFIMLNGATEAEKAGGLIHDVWYNTIYDKYDAETSKYTSGHSDFNDSLQALFEDSDFQKQISDIRDNQSSVNSIMKLLKNPPEEYEEAYDALKDYYDAYLELTNLVVNPTGSLQSFTSNFNDADSAVVKYYEAMKIYTE